MVEKMDVAELKGYLRLRDLTSHFEMPSEGFREQS